LKLCSNDWNLRSCFCQICFISETINLIAKSVLISFIKHFMPKYLSLYLTLIRQQFVLTMWMVLLKYFFFDQLKLSGEIYRRHFQILYCWKWYMIVLTFSLMIANLWTMSFKWTWLLFGWNMSLALPIFSTTFLITVCIHHSYHLQ